MSIPPPGWYSNYIDEEAARREARLESSRVRRFVAKAFRVLLILVIVAIVIALAFTAFMVYVASQINGFE
ncbi:hypothetical protein [Sanguibacter gelidistatuariae]|nr:hypothetical protein [Sanguibacter gelidistatuariae]